MGVYFAWITAYQREFFTALRHALIALRTGRRGAALFSSDCPSFTASFTRPGPGHGKAVISSYIVANRVELKARHRLVRCRVPRPGLDPRSASSGPAWFFLRGNVPSR